jgi:hypothetical protein
MMDFQLQNNDIKISNGDICLCDSEIDATAQAIAIRLKTLAGEWFLDQNLGLPYLIQILGKKRNDLFLVRILTQEIEKVPGVLKLSDFSFDENTTPRSVVVKFNATLANQLTITIKESIGV